MRRGDVVEPPEVRALAPLRLPQAERETLARRVEGSEGVVEEPERAVVVAEDPLEEVARLVEGLPDHPAPERLRVGTARRRDPAVLDDQTAAVGGDPHGVTPVELPQELRVLDQELHGLRRHGEQAVVEEGRVPVGEQAKAEPLSRFGILEDHAPPDLGRNRGGDIEGDRLEDDRLPRVHPGVQSGDPEAGGAQGLAPGCGAAVRVRTHEVAPGVAQQQESGDLEELFQPVPRLRILLNGFDAHGPVPPPRPPPGVQKRRDRARVLFRLGSGARKEMQSLDGVEEEFGTGGDFAADARGRLQSLRRPGDLDRVEIRPRDRFGEDRRNRRQQGRQTGGRQNALGSQRYSNR